VSADVSLNTKVLTYEALFTLVIILTVMHSTHAPGIIWDQEYKKELFIFIISRSIRFALVTRITYMQNQWYQPISIKTPMLPVALRYAYK
jgi:hypothetical protein